MPAVGGFTTRVGGTSDAPWSAANLALHTGDEWDRVHVNRDLLAKKFGLSYRDLVFGRQVHGTGVRVVEHVSARARDRGLPDTDALVTTVPGIALVMMGADCPPVLLADPSAGVVGVAHVGRQGLACGVLVETVRVMAEQGARAASIQAVVGPGVCGRCYEVPAQLADEVEQLAPGSRSTTRSGAPSIDLAAGAVAQLHRLGVPTVSTVGGCTMEQTELFYSYRQQGLTGRHAGIVVLR